MLTWANDNEKEKASAPDVPQPLKTEEYQKAVAVTAGKDGDSGDIVSSARSIAIWWWNDPTDQARKRVYNLWAYYRQEDEQLDDPVPFFKMGGTLCISKRAFRAWLKRNQGWAPGNDNANSETPAVA